MTNPQAVQSIRERGCTSKVRFDSAGEAELAARTRMLANATAPLAVYECWYCTGYHLTSSTVVSANTVELETPVMRVDMYAALSHEMAREGFYARKRKWLRSEQIRMAQQRRKNRQKAEFFAKTPPPQVASAAEAAEFFAKHSKTG